MTLATLRRKARNGTLEVEDILNAAVARCEGLADELEVMCVSCGWTNDGGMSGNGSRLIPFRKWAAVAIAYSRGGWQALGELLRTSPDMHSFVYGLLEEAHDPGSLSVIIRGDGAVLADPSVDRQRAHRIARAVNLLLSFPPWIEILEQDRVTLCAFLHQLVPLCSQDNERACAILALRGVGDADSLKLLGTEKVLGGPWADTIKVTTRSIRKRLRLNAAS